MAVLEKPATTSVPVMDVVRDRWSPRSFASTPVPAAALTAVLEAGRWAASSNNGQPWRWIVATSADPAAIATAVSCFNARNQRWTKTAPVLMPFAEGPIDVDRQVDWDLANRIVAARENPAA